jgi:hypothetical protein
MARSGPPDLALSARAGEGARLKYTVAERYSVQLGVFVLVRARPPAWL